jgi:predicted lipoprotein with Yx(FWY)xxD motif
VEQAHVVAMMNPLPVAFFLILLIQAASPTRADEKDSSSSIAQIVYPANVALSEEPPKGMVFRHFPSGLRLYVYDQDSPGKSVCTAGCESAWPPLIARAGSRPMGDWTLVTRDDGQKQWAYKGRPIYMRFHDDPNKPMGDGLDGLWHLLGHFAK